MLVVGASLSLIAPISAQASNIVDIEEMSSYVRRSKKKSFRPDSNTFINPVSEDTANLEDLKVKQNNFEAGSFSDTTTLDGKAIFTLAATDHSNVKSDGTDSLTANYTYTMNLNTSFTGDDNLYVRIKTGNHSGNNVTKTFGTYLSSGNGNSDALKVDKIWYTFPVGEKNTFWVGPKIENYSCMELHLLSISQ